MTANPALIATWVEAWAITRGVAPPIARFGAYYVEVGLPDQRARYVFAALDRGAIAALGRTVVQPWIYLKVCAPEAEVRALLPAQWQIRTPPTYMMTAGLAAPRQSLPAGYRLSFEREGGVLVASIDVDGAHAARGRLVVLRDIATFDQIRTEEVHRRRGLGRAIMAALTASALDDGVTLGVLSATEMGRSLYETLGWTVYAPYTSAVIPGD